MRATPIKEHSKAACTLELKKFLQVAPFPFDSTMLSAWPCKTPGNCMQAPILDFGSIKVGVCKSLELVLNNSDQQEQVEQATFAVRTSHCRVTY